MDTEQTIAEIEWLERIFAMPDTRPMSEAISRLRIEDTTKCSLAARGFGCGSGIRRNGGLDLHTRPKHRSSSLHLRSKLASSEYRISPAVDISFEPIGVSKELW